MDETKQLNEEDVLNPEVMMLQNNKTSGYNYRYRRHQDWLETYDLYRDKVFYNRLTQRQSVNVPFMKEQVRTLLKDVDDMPVLYFENLDNDKQAELFKNEYWKYTVEENRMELQDIIDKRQVFLFGRSYDQWQIVDGKVVMTVQDPMDILISRYADPFNIHSSRFLIHDHIFVPLSTLEENEDYEQKEIQEIKNFLATDMGLVKAASNVDSLAEKNQKMSDMGVLDIDTPVLGETYVELSMHFVFRPKGEKWTDTDGSEQETDEEQIFLYVLAENMRMLMKKPLEKVIGVTSDHWWRNHYPYNSWADDLERQDWFSDAIGDIVRTANKILNTWYSQWIENRTLRSLGMTFYDDTAEGFNPQVWQPQAFGFYGLPGKPSDIIQRVDLPDLSDSPDGMNFIMEMIKRATGGTATQEGAQTERQITLGEVQLALGEAKERVKGMSKFYTPAWKERGQMFIKLVEAAPEKLDAVTVYKKGRNTDKIYSREISPDDWEAKAGYRCKVWSMDEKQAQDTQTLNTLNAANTLMPGNPKLVEIIDRKVLELADLKPDEINEIMQYEQDKQAAMAAMQEQMAGQGLPSGNGAPPPTPLQPQAPMNPALPTQQPKSVVQ